jgi:CBS domain-containing protein
MPEPADEELERLNSAPAPENVLTGEAFAQPLSVLLSKTALCIKASAPIRDAVALMRDNGYGAILAVEDDQLAGILTERDILFKFVGVVDDFLDQPVSAAMTRDPGTSRSLLNLV